MNAQSRENHIATLKKLRDEYRSQLDDGGLSDLDLLIAELEEVREKGLTVAEGARMASRALEAIASVLTLVTNVCDWLK